MNRPGFHVLQILLITVRVSTQFYFVTSFEWVAFEQEHALSKHRCSVYSTTLFKMGGRDQKVPLPVFFPWNVGTSPQNFVTFGFNRLPHWCKTSRLYLVVIPNYWTWTKPTPQKNCIFWSNPCTIVLMIPMISYQTLVTWPHVQYNLSYKIKFWWWRHEQQLWCHIQNSFVLRRATVANFAGVIQIATMFIKTTFKDLKK